MPNQIASDLNRTASALFLAAEINGATNPFLAVTFAVGSGQRFNFQGLITECNSNETVAGLKQFVVFGEENLLVLPTDSLQGLFTRTQRSNRIFRHERIFEQLNEHHLRTSDLFSFPDIRSAVGQITFFCGIIGAGFVNNVVVSLTVYGELVSENKKPFPYTYR